MLKLAENVLPARGLACREAITIPLNLFTHVSFIIVTHCMVVLLKMGGSYLREKAREQVCDSRMDFKNFSLGLSARCPVATKRTSVLCLEVLMLTLVEFPSACSKHGWYGCFQSHNCEIHF